jgi:hypothetical protein
MDDAERKAMPGAIHSLNQTRGSDILSVPELYLVVLTVMPINTYCIVKFNLSRYTVYGVPAIFPSS